MKKNGKKAPFQIGDEVRFLFGDDQTPKVITWITKGSPANRGEQLVAVNGHSHYIDADTLVEKVNQ